jgi:N-acetylglucosamine-6-phosphate deacetylase
MLITDDMGLTGSDDTAFELQDRRIALNCGRLTDAAGTLAGAHITMFDTVRNAVRLMDVDLADALVMASRTPAHFLGLGDDLGRIAPGFRASLVAFRSDAVIATWVDGQREESS